MNEQILNPTFAPWVAEFLQRPCEVQATRLGKNLLTLST